MNARAARSAVVLVAAVLALVAGCASAAQFESDAGQTAQDGLSAVRTALIGVRTALDGGLPDPYLVTVLQDAEDSLSSTQESFRSMQPPADAGADRLRGELSTLLTRGVDGLAQLRIAAQRGDEQQLATTAADLGPVADALDRFEQEHSS
jgi:hypothetical protein